MENIENNKENSIIDLLKSKLNDLEEYIKLNESVFYVSKQNFDELHIMYNKFDSKQTLYFWIRFFGLSLIELTSIFFSKYIPSSIFLSNIACTSGCVFAGIILNDFYKGYKIRKEGKKLEKIHEKHVVLKEDLSYAKELVEKINLCISMYEEMDKENDVLFAAYEEEVKKAYNEMFNVDFDCVDGIEEHNQSKLQKVIASRKKKSENNRPKTLRIPAIYQ